MPNPQEEARKSASSPTAERIKNAQLNLRRDNFMTGLLRHLSGALQETIGLEHARGFVSDVGKNMGEEIDSAYCTALKVEKLNREQLAQVLVDLKRRIDGDFYIIEETDEKIVLGNNRCPFGKHIEGRPSLCMMTSNVFGTIASKHSGYAKVELKQSIARGDSGCKVVVYLKPTGEAEEAHGDEFFHMED